MIRLLLLVGACISLGACGGRSSTVPDARTASGRADAERSGAPVISDQSVSRREPESPYRTVVRGDTLYSIAWESGRDYRELAKWNRILPPYLIKPGQQLRVIPPGQGADIKPKPAVPDTKAATQERDSVPPSRSAAGKATPGKTGAKTAVRPASKAPPVAATAPRTSPKPATGGKKESGKSSVAHVGKLAWSWPADGALLNRYSEGETRGLDIAGTRGSSVRAAAGGRVVYQGSGLRGYGQLIIIKHNDEFLSAYAHNDRIHIKEGDAVKRGQKIAEMGSTGTDRIKLHFEIRRQGIPVDPIKYLPKR